MFGNGALNRWSYNAIAALSLIAAGTPALATEVGEFRFSAAAGQVGLFGDPGQGGANALGVGLGIGYQFDDQIAFDIQYTMSNHSDVEHADLAVGADYYFGDYEKAYPHLSVGFSFLNNKFKNVGSTGEAAGIYVGGGLAFELNRNVTVGPELRFQKAFDSKGTVAGRQITTVADSYSLLLKLTYSPGSD